MIATGGTESTCGDFKYHKFTGPGTFTVTDAGTAAGSNTLTYLVVGGGGTGGNRRAGGGGAGGLRTITCETANKQAYPVTVGGGGASVAGPETGSGDLAGNPGNNSVFSGTTSNGGGGGGQACGVGSNGGSGGGSSRHTNSNVGGTATQPSSDAGGLGNNGGNTGPTNTNPGGGGGAGKGPDNASEVITGPCFGCGSMKHKMVMNIMSSTDAKTAREPGLCNKHAKRAEGAG